MPYTKENHCDNRFEGVFTFQYFVAGQERRFRIKVFRPDPKREAALRTDGIAVLANMEKMALDAIGDHAKEFRVLGQLAVPIEHREGSDYEAQRIRDDRGQQVANPVAYGLLARDYSRLPEKLTIWSWESVVRAYRDLLGDLEQLQVIGFTVFGLKPESLRYEGPKEPQSFALDDITFVGATKTDIYTREDVRERDGDLEEREAHLRRFFKQALGYYCPPELREEPVYQFRMHVLKDQAVYCAAAALYFLLTGCEPCEQYDGEGNPALENFPEVRNPESFIQKLRDQQVPIGVSNALRKALQQRNLDRGTLQGLREALDHALPTRPSPQTFRWVSAYHGKRFELDPASERPGSKNDWGVESFNYRECLNLHQGSIRVRKFRGITPSWEVVSFDEPLQANGTYEGGETDIWLAVKSPALESPRGANVVASIEEEEPVPQAHHPLGFRDRLFIGRYSFDREAHAVLVRRPVVRRFTSLEPLDEKWLEWVKPFRDTLYTVASRPEAPEYLRRLVFEWPLMTIADIIKQLQWLVWAFDWRNQSAGIGTFDRRNSDDELPERLRILLPSPVEIHPQAAISPDAVLVRPGYWGPIQEFLRMRSYRYGISLQELVLLCRGEMDHFAADGQVLGEAILLVGTPRPEQKRISFVLDARRGHDLEGFKQFLGGLRPRRGAVV